MVCLDKGVLAWRRDAIPLKDEDGRILVNKVQLLHHTNLQPGTEVQVY